MQGKGHLQDQLSRDLRSGIVSIVQELGTQPTPTLILGDIFGLHGQVTQHPEQYGLTNVSDPCVLWGNVGSKVDPRQHLYWDDSHFTAVFHALVADSLYDAVCDSLG
jgi:outer membrane lipase/esterase